MGSKVWGWWVRRLGWRCCIYGDLLGSFADGLHHSHLGVRLCVPPWGPPHLHRAAQVCSYDRKLLLALFGQEIMHIKKEENPLCFVLGLPYSSHMHCFHFILKSLNTACVVKHEWSRFKPLLLIFPKRMLDLFLNLGTIYFVARNLENSV